MIGIERDMIQWNLRVDMYTALGYIGRSGPRAGGSVLALAKRLYVVAAC